MSAAPHSDTAARPLLVELFTEELPPKALQRLGLAFADTLHAGLVSRGLAAEDSTVTPYATPRRLAARVSSVLAQAADKPYSEKLMPVSVGLTADGLASPALQKKLAAKGLQDIDVSTLARESDGKADQLVYRGVARGAVLADGLQQALDEAIARLPIPKVMGYQLADGVTTVKFVRPAHGLVALHGTDVVPLATLGLTAGRVTHGHRFQAQGPVTLASADDYESALTTVGRSIPSFVARRDAINAQLRSHAAQLGASLGDEADVAPLLDEVTALVEYPTVYVGRFDAEFLAVPQECLILTMRLNQKYFPLFEADGRTLTNAFLIVSNMALDDPSNIIQGNQRVVRPRLADAQFFFDADRKVSLASRVPQLGSIVYHNKLGTQLERAGRVAVLAGWIAQALGGDAAHAQRAAQLAKADLVTNMVGEFPELQGIMGAYYAAGDGEAAPVVAAIRDQYRIRLDVPVTTDTVTAAALFIADRAETLAGIWSIGLSPTGDRDPFGLRRAALGLISAFEQLAAGGLLKVQDHTPALTLPALLAQVQQGFGVHPEAPAQETSATPPAATGKPGRGAKEAAPEPGSLRVSDATVAEVQSFVFERYRNQLGASFDRGVIDAVLAIDPPLHQVPARVAAVTAFQALPEAESLAAANKRIGNLLKKVEGELSAFDASRPQEPAERALAEVVAQLGPQTQALAAQGDFAGALSALAGARAAVDGFFADVMVMADDPAVRANRLALLGNLHRLMNQVADLSRLAS